MLENEDEVRELLDAARRARRDKSLRDAQFRTDLELAEYHVAQGSVRVERQRGIVRLLHKRGSDAVLAEELLTQFEDILTVQIQLLKDLTGWKKQP